MLTFDRYKRVSALPRSCDRLRRPRERSRGAAEGASAAPNVAPRSQSAPPTRAAHAVRAAGRARPAAAGGRAPAAAARSGSPSRASARVVAPLPARRPSPAASAAASASAASASPLPRTRSVPATARRRRHGERLGGGRGARAHGYSSLFLVEALSNRATCAFHEGAGDRTRMRMIEHRGRPGSPTISRVVGWSGSDSPRIFDRCCSKICVCRH